QAHRSFCLHYDAFSVAEAVLPSRVASASGEVRIFHPPKDDTNRQAILADRAGLWKGDVYGDRKAEAAAKEASEESKAGAARKKEALQKLGSRSSLSARLGLKTKDKGLSEAEAERVEEENRVKSLNAFTSALGAFIAGGEDVVPTPSLPAPISEDLLEAAKMTSPIYTSLAPSTGLKAVPPPAHPTGLNSLPGRPPPPSAAAPLPGMSRPPPPRGMPPMPTPGGGSGASGSTSKPLGMLSGTMKSQNLVSQPPSVHKPLDDAGGALREERGRSLTDSSAASPAASAPGVAQIVEMGFSEDQAKMALEVCSGDVHKAIDVLVSQSESTLSPPLGSPVAVETKGSTNGGSTTTVEKKTKAKAAQNPIFDKEAFTPTLIPARQQQPNALQQQQPRLMTPTIVLSSGGLGSGSRPLSVASQGTGLDRTLARPSSTPAMISALDPDSVAKFDMEKNTNSPRHKSMGTLVPAPGGGVKTVPAGGLEQPVSTLQRSSDQVMSSARGSTMLTAMPPMPTMPTRPITVPVQMPGTQLLQPQQLQPNQQSAFSTSMQPRPSPRGGPAQTSVLTGAALLGAGAQSQQSGPSPARTPVPVGAAPVGGARLLPARTPVPSGAAAVGGAIRGPVIGVGGAAGGVQGPASPRPTWQPQGVPNQPLQMQGTPHPLAGQPPRLQTQWGQQQVGTQMLRSQQPQQQQHQPRPQQQVFGLQ
ncbi:unnamed protein product, partial [Choristocarpus tenellus]